jgi:uncharacterized Zn-binding protein involved in type VI secretion
MARLQLPATGTGVGKRRHAVTTTAATIKNDVMITAMIALGEYPHVKGPQDNEPGSSKVSTATMKMLCDSIQCIRIDTAKRGMLK